MGRSRAARQRPPAAGGRHGEWLPAVSVGRGEEARQGAGLGAHGSRASAATTRSVDHGGTSGGYGYGSDRGRGGIGRGPQRGAQGRGIELASEGEDRGLTVDLQVCTSGLGGARGRRIWRRRPAKQMRKEGSGRRHGGFRVLVARCRGRRGGRGGRGSRLGGGRRRRDDGEASGVWRWGAGGLGAPIQNRDGGKRSEGR